ncbi:MULTISPECIES: thiamine diphosphokinase [unclassified Cytobacillus]|uniref:thiamine diphosphokinase n=1 Tax=unclassified Cytobacillus TaxID=2675268 RepID=UPI001357EA63|nr:thiamine diphosphokinase [Cytobacillus sp. AMY 15.2]KAF0820318.1 thiamine pyrophosphokinase [Bacillus sp. ZZV12-4809]MCM3089544.1 thiamine diphosphokinase [Cytobacillus sp. AMY 15.2]
MIINILAGGPDDLLPDLSSLNDTAVIWVGVDRGVLTLIQRGIQPQKAFGDFDSVSTDELLIIEENVKELNRFKPEKDETDMELALNWALGQKPEKVRLLGATGGRLDHLFANIQLLIKPALAEFLVPVEIIDKTNMVYIKTPGQYSIKKYSEFKYISFVPITMEIKGLTLRNFKYPLTDRTVFAGSTLCISNELIDDCGTFSFTEGILMVVRSKD